MILLVAVNSKYIHTNLAVRSLRAYAGRDDVEIAEFTINEPLLKVMADIYRKKPRAVFFSMYIWNAEFVMALGKELKKVMPDVKIFMGGPEVSYDSCETLEKCLWADGILRHEGEETFRELCGAELDCRNIDGVTYRSGGRIYENKDRPLIEDISSIPFPYTDDEMERLRGKLIYYESSRGCPFNCSYCLSSTVHSLRFRDLETVKKELLFFVRHKVKIVKFVDRTFNADRKRACELMRFLVENADETTFHFEAAADLINDEMTEIFKNAPKGLFQLEIGVQSTNSDTIRAIDRKTDFEKIACAVKCIKSSGNVHTHLDLIAGLPYEGYESFKKSFNDVFVLEPDALQLGFLKLLKGTKISAEKEKYHYKNTSCPPYEVLENDFISYSDILRLKNIEEVFERYHNSGDFENTEKYLLKKNTSAFDMYEELAGYFERKGLFDIAHSRDGLFDILAERYYNDTVFLDVLKYDYIKGMKRPRTPGFAGEYDKSLVKKRFDILSDEYVQKNLPEYSGMQARELVKRLHFERFDYDVTGNMKKLRHILIFDNDFGRVLKYTED